MHLLGTTGRPGPGVATRATAELARWALDGLELHRLELMHSIANPPSCRVADKAGFTLEGTLRSALLHPDGWHDLHLHARLRGDA
jgi:RimJ/RimL family protein N-acetyltransferase